MDCSPPPDRDRPPQIKTEVNFDGAAVTVLDCSGDARTSGIVKKFFHRAVYVIVVYDLCAAKSLDAALEVLSEAQAAGAACVLFGSKWQVDAWGGSVSADDV